ncbi:MAG: tRNA pseudouridine(38-40) synthase TruA [Candidatus Omnitrophica bacterium]|nr:tRNA pseudouridine(38-40) synthase TruA [Candidatus Omnitrophota bacterium]
MRNIKLTIEYDGTNYVGFQTQRTKDYKSPTIQETLEEALKKVCKRKTNLVASGRTDSGVHALAQVANFKTDSKMPLDKFRVAINANIPEDISVTKVEEADADFHSRYSAKSKIYRYLILNRPYRSVFEGKYCYLFTYKLDFDLMKREIRCLLGKHDFKAFQAADKKKKKSVRTIKNIKLSKKNDLIIFEIEADGFLFKMVRNIVGTLIEIGRGRFKKGSMKRILESKNRKLAGPTAPARGLCLLKVIY